MSCRSRFNKHGLSIDRQEAFIAAKTATHSPQLRHAFSALVYADLDIEPWLKLSGSLSTPALDLLIKTQLKHPAQGEALRAFASNSLNKNLSAEQHAALAESVYLAQDPGAAMTTIHARLTPTSSERSRAKAVFELTALPKIMAPMPADEAARFMAWTLSEDHFEIADRFVALAQTASWIHADATEKEQWLALCENLDHYHMDALLQLLNLRLFANPATHRRTALTRAMLKATPQEAIRALIEEWR